MTNTPDNDRPFWPKGDDAYENDGFAVIDADAMTPPGFDEEMAAFVKDMKVKAKQARAAEAGGPAG